jgi:toxin FitB
VAFLLDTMVVSEAIKRRPHESVLAWTRRQPAASLFISVVTIGEIERGIAMAEARDPASAVRWRDWVGTLVASSGSRLLAADLEVLLEWGRLSAKAGHKSMDVLIAATALVHDLTVATRNRADFERLGAAVFDPYTD